MQKKDYILVTGFEIKITQQVFKCLESNGVEKDKI